MSTSDIPENQLRKLRWEEGFRNSEDIDDSSTQEEETQEKVEEVLLPISIQISRDASPETKSIADNARKFAIRMALKCRQKFWKELEKYRQEHTTISDKMVQFIKDKQLDVPRFWIYDEENARVFLHKHQFNDAIDEKNVLLVMDLPKPVAWFGWKGGPDFRSHNKMSTGQTLEHRVAEWGSFYDHLMLTIWEELDSEVSQGGLYLSRVNPVGTHQPLNYYYIYEASHTPFDEDEREDEYSKAA